MLNKPLFFLLIIMCCSTLFARGKKDINEYTGGLVSYGSEPFTFTAFITDDEQEFNIVADEKTKEKLLESWGKHLYVKGVILKKEEVEFKSIELDCKDGYLKIINVEVLE